MRWLNRNPERIAETPPSRPALGTSASPEISVGPPPTSSNGQLLEDLGQVVRTTKDSDVAGREISGFGLDGRSRLIEVKTTNGWERTPFFHSRNEIALSEERCSDSRLIRLWNFCREPTAIEIRPPLEARVSLTATAFRADSREAREPHVNEALQDPSSRLVWVSVPFRGISMHAWPRNPWLRLRTYCLPERVDLLSRLLAAMASLPRRWSGSRRSWPCTPGRWPEERPPWLTRAPNA